MVMQEFGRTYPSCASLQGHLCSLVQAGRRNANLSWPNQIQLPVLCPHPPILEQRPPDPRLDVLRPPVTLDEFFSSPSDLSRVVVVRAGLGVRCAVEEGHEGRKVGRVERERDIVVPRYKVVAEPLRERSRCGRSREMKFQRCKSRRRAGEKGLTLEDHRLHLQKLSEPSRPAKPATRRKSVSNH